MGVSVNGQICYGVVFGEGYEFPWDASDGGDLDDWWVRESGWRWAGEEPFTGEGELAEGFSREDPRIAAYFESRRAWLGGHPAPVVEVNYQSGDEPAWILAIPASLVVARCGYPWAIDPRVLLFIEAEAEAELLAFCERYGLTPEGGPGWYLSSFWG